MKRALVAVGSVLIGLVVPLAVAAPARAYSAQSGSTVHSDYLGSVGPDTGHYDTVTDRGVPVGRHDGGVDRGLWELSLPVVPAGSLILSAELDMHTQTAGGCHPALFDLYSAPGGFDARTTWNAPPAVTGPIASTLVPSSSSGPCAQGYFGFDATTLVANSYAADQSSLPVEVRAQDENDPAAFKYLTPDATVAITYDAPPDQPVVSAIDGEPCAHPMRVLGVTQWVQPSVAINDPDDNSLTLTLQLYTANLRTELAHQDIQTFGPSDQAYTVTPARPLVTGQVYAVRAITRDQHQSSVASAWCYFRIDDRVPSTPTQSTTSFGTTSAVGYVGTPGTVTVGGGGPATARYELAVSGNFSVGATCGSHSAEGSTICTTDGAPVTFTFTPTSQYFILCVHAVSRSGETSSSSCQFYVVNPAVLPPVQHEWASAGVAPGAASVADTGTGSPVALQLSDVAPTSDGRLGFTAASTATARNVIGFDRPWSMLLDLETPGDTPQTAVTAGPLTVQVGGPSGAEVCLAGSCGYDTEFWPGQSNQLVLTWNPRSDVLAIYGFGQGPQDIVTVPGLAAGPHNLVFGGDSAAPFVGSTGTTELFASTLPSYEAAELIQTW